MIKSKPLHMTIEILQLAMHRARLLRLLLAALVACVMVPGAALAQSVVWTERVVSSPSPRLDPAMAYDAARGVSVLFGGFNNVFYGDTWEWNGTVWTQRMVSGPSARYSHAMAYDSARGVTVLFGGYNSIPHNGETWEWNGTSWTQRLVSGPSPRFSHAMAYDSARGVTVLFGGFYNNNFDNNPANRDAETWEWNGTVWTQRAVSGPAARGAHAMAYDVARGVTVLNGGWTGSYNNETWEWNGTVWTQRLVSGPPARGNHAMAYDTARGVTVLFGGDYAPNDTWEWNGAGGGTWTQHVVNGPSERGTHAMAYDVLRRKTVLFGGFPGPDNTTAWEMCGAASITTHPVPQTICVHSTVSFSVVASFPSGTLTYQWQRKNPVFFNVYNDIFNGPTGNGGTYSGAQSPMLTISTVGANDQGDFRCVVTNACAGVPSNDASLNVISSESIAFQPAPQSACFGGTAAFSVAASPPNGTFSYQWQKKNPIFFNVYNDIFNGPTGNGGTYSGAQSPILTIAGVFPNDLGEFRCVVNGVCQSIVSNDASLDGPPSPFVTSGPNVVAGCAGGSGSISISAIPAGSTYQWQRYVGPCVLCYVNVSNGPTGSGGTLSGAQSPTLTITGLNQTETFAQYRCIVTGPCANTPLAASGDAFFAIMGLPQAAAPAPPVVCPGGTVSISMNTQNVTSFLWEYYSSFLNGWVPFSNGPLNDFGAGMFATVSGANTDTLTLSNTFLGAPIAIRFSGGNMCQIMAPIQTLLNYPALPTITSQPATTSYCFGQPALFTVGANSQLPLTYQWQLYHTALLQWINLSDGFYVGGATGLSGTIAGATTPTLTFTTATIGTVAPNQPFRCIVSHGCGSVTSQTANLYICAADVNCDGNVDFFDYLDFVDAFSEQSPVGDFNQDNSIDFFDYLDFVDAFSLGC